MRIVRSILLVGFSLFLAYRTYDLILQLNARSVDNYSLGQTIVLAIIINLFLTGVFALPGFALPTSSLMPNRYYHIKNPKSLILVYKSMGLAYFRVFLMLMFWGRKKNRAKYFNGRRAGIDNLLYQSKQSEFGHLVSFVVILWVTALLASKGYLLLFFVATILNIVANVYPVILQRHHRMRVARLAESFEVSQ